MALSEFERRMLQDTHDSTIRQEQILKGMQTSHDELETQLWQHEKRLGSVEAIATVCNNRRKLERKFTWLLVGSVILAAGTSLWNWLTTLGNTHGK